MLSGKKNCGRMASAILPPSVVTVTIPGNLESFTIRRIAGYGIDIHVHDGIEDGTTYNTVEGFNRDTVSDYTINDIPVTTEPKFVTVSADRLLILNYGYSSILTVEEFAPAGNIDITEAFYDCGQLTNVVGIDLSNYKHNNLYLLFAACTSLTYIEPFQIGNGCGLNSAFEGCSISSNPVLNIHVAGNLYRTFYRCAYLTQFIILGNPAFETVSTSEMFRESGIVEVGNLTLSKINSARSMFYACSNLTTVGNLNLGRGTNLDLGYMFFNCTSLQLCPLITTNSPYIDGAYLFQGCGSMWGSFTGTHNFITLERAFMACKIEYVNCVLPVCNSFQRCFAGCGELITVNINAPNTTATTEAFINCTKLENVTFINSTTNHVTTTDMFFNCRMLAALPTGFTYNLLNCRRMFNLAGIDNPNSNIVLENIQITINMIMDSFYGLELFKDSAVRHIENVTFNLTNQNAGLKTVFYNCALLETVDGLTVATELHPNGINADSMFNGCVQLTSVENIDMLVSIADAMFKDTALTSLVDGVDISHTGVKSIAYMYYGTNITHIDSLIIGPNVVDVGAMLPDGLIDIDEIKTLGTILAAHSSHRCHLFNPSTNNVEYIGKIEIAGNYGSWNGPQTLLGGCPKLEEVGDVVCGVGVSRLNGLFQSTPLLVSVGTISGENIASLERTFFNSGIAAIPEFDIGPHNNGMSLRETFYGCVNLTDAIVGSGLDVTGDVSLYSPFGRCFSLNTLSLWFENVANITIKDIHFGFFGFSSEATYSLTEFTSNAGHLFNHGNFYMYQTQMVNLSLSGIGAHVNASAVSLYRMLNLNTTTINQFMEGIGDRSSLPGGVIELDPTQNGYLTQNSRDVLGTRNWSLSIVDDY